MVFVSLEEKLAVKVGNIDGVQIDDLDIPESLVKNIN